MKHCITIGVGILILILPLLSKASSELHKEEFVQTPNCTHDVSRDPGSPFIREIKPEFGGIIQLLYDLHVANLSSLDCVYNLEAIVESSIMSNDTYGRVQLLPENHRSTESVFELFPSNTDITVRQTLRFMSGSALNMTVTMWDMKDSTQWKKIKSVLVYELPSRKIQLVVSGTTLGKSNGKCMEALNVREMCTPAAEAAYGHKRSIEKILRWAVPLPVGILVLLALVSVMFYKFRHQFRGYKLVGDPDDDPDDDVDDVPIIELMVADDESCEHVDDTANPTSMELCSFEGVLPDNLST